MSRELAREELERALNPHLPKRQRTFKAQQEAMQAIRTTVATEDMGGLLQSKTGYRGGKSGVGGDLQLDVQSHLNELETQVLALMSEAVNLSKSCTVVRVAGGWVRDKLLGLEVSAYCICCGHQLPAHGKLYYNSCTVCPGVLVACKIGLCEDNSSTCRRYSLS